MDIQRNRYAPPRAGELVRTSAIRKPSWPHTPTPYLIPSHLMFWGLVSSGVLEPFGIAAAGQLVFWLGLLAWVYAFRKQPPHRKAERIWWTELRRRQKDMNYTAR